MVEFMDIHFRLYGKECAGRTGVLCEDLFNLILGAFHAPVVLRVVAGTVERDDHEALQQLIDFMVVKVAAVVALDKQRWTVAFKQFGKVRDNVMTVGKMQSDQGPELKARSQILNIMQVGFGILFICISHDEI